MNTAGSNVAAKFRVACHTDPDGSIVIKDVPLRPPLFPVPHRARVHSSSWSSSSSSSSSALTKYEQRLSGNSARNEAVWVRITATWAYMKAYSGADLAAYEKGARGTCERLWQESDASRNHIEVIPSEKAQLQRRPSNLWAFLIIVPDTAVRFAPEMSDSNQMRWVRQDPYSA